jgi:hypothetical protein
MLLASAQQAEPKRRRASLGDTCETRKKPKKMADDELPMANELEILLQLKSVIGG